MRYLQDVHKIKHTRLIAFVCLTMKFCLLIDLQTMNNLYLFLKKQIVLYEQLMRFNVKIHVLFYGNNSEIV
jgi:hypothetical protein